MCVCIYNCQCQNVSFVYGFGGWERTEKSPEYNVMIEGTIFIELAFFFKAPIGNLDFRKQSHWSFLAYIYAKTMVYVMVLYLFVRNSYEFIK